MTCSYTCKACGSEIECKFIDESDDLPERCPECYAIIPESAHEAVYQQVVDRSRDSLEP